MEIPTPKAIALVAYIVMFIIRAVHGIPVIGVRVAKRHLHAVQDLPLWIVKFSVLLPIVWAVSSLFEFADYPPHTVTLIAGTPCYALGLWLFHWSHPDLGTNWSQTLEIKENHYLVNSGIYSRIRHPMYLATLIFTVGQALVVPNYIAGPSFGIGMVILIALRAGREERMMLEQFGDEYASYCKHTNRLIPGIW